MPTKLTTLILSTIAIAGIAGADTLRVPAEHRSIQTAIDNAVDGDLILISPGVWPERLELAGKNIVIQGDGSAHEVVLRSPDGGTMLELDGDTPPNPTFADLSFTGGVDAPLVRIDNASPLFERCIFRDNLRTAVADGGPCGQNSGAMFLSCLFIDNHNTNAAGLALTNSNSVVEECAFVRNIVSGQPAPYVSAGGAIYVSNWDCGINAFTIRNCDFIDNSAVWGGAMYAQGNYPSAAADLVITGCRFIGNQASEGRCLWLWYIDGDISNSYFCGGGDQIHNGWGDMGGNVFADSCNASELEDCDGDRIPDVLAITLGLADDCNGDGRPDPCTAGDPKIDADGDGIPDVCQNPPCPADLSGNGVVDGGDLGIWASLVGYDCQSDPECPADVNGDGVADGADLGAILANWGPCPE